MIEFVKGFLQSGNGDSSSKRLLMILAYVASITVGVYCGFAHIALDSNVLILMLGLSGVSTANYAVTNKNETKKVKDDKQSQD